MASPAFSQITVNYTIGSSLASDPQSAQIIGAFQRAANNWTAQFDNTFKFNFTIDFRQLSVGVLGSTNSSQGTISYDGYRSALAGTAHSADDFQAISSLPTSSSLPLLLNGVRDNPNGRGSLTPYLDNNGDANNATIRMTLANAKAMGLLDPNNSATDAAITFSSRYRSYFDFNPDDGISAGQFDFVGIATHEIGHALGLQHNMVASNSIPVDSLRSPTFTSKYGVSLTIMDYARQNYVAQPGDGLKPKDFIRRVGPFDDFAINWGYRVLPVRNADEEKVTLNQWITSQSGFFAYRYVPQQLGSLDPRAQTEDVGDDAMKASGYAIKNMKVMVPSLLQWTTKAGNDFGDLAELYDEALQMWSLYMGHVTTWIGGVNVDNKTADQAGAVFRIVPKAKQKSALTFLNDNVFTTPLWLEPKEISSRIGPSGLAARQSNVLTSLLSTARLGRMADEEKFDAANAYPLEEFMGDLRRDVFGGSADANRRALQRTYVARLGAIMHPPTVVAGPAFGGQGGGGAARPSAPFLAPTNLERSDLPAVARQQLRDIQREARTSSVSAKSAIERAHWADLADRAKEILEPRK